MPFGLLEHRQHRLARHAGPAAEHGGDLVDGDQLAGLLGEQRPVGSGVDHDRLELLAEQAALLVLLVDEHQHDVLQRGLADRHGAGQGMQDADLDGGPGGGGGRRGGGRLGMGALGGGKAEGGGEGRGREAGSPEPGRYGFHGTPFLICLATGAVRAASLTHRAETASSVPLQHSRSGKIVGNYLHLKRTAGLGTLPSN